jgi:hypothetical protein
MSKFLLFSAFTIFRQKNTFCQSLALETSSLNCLIVLAAIRFTLQKPAADLASHIPIWTPTIYTILICMQKKFNMYYFGKWC